MEKGGSSQEFGTCLFHRSILLYVHFSPFSIELEKFFNNPVLVKNFLISNKQFYKYLIQSWIFLVKGKAHWDMQLNSGQKSTKNILISLKKITQLHCRGLEIFTILKWDLYQKMSFLRLKNIVIRALKLPN